jgi:alkylhydroperoxidase family enzyme
MLGIGALHSAIKWFGAIDARLLALLQLQAARLHRASYWGDIRHAVGVKAGVPAEKLDALDAYEDWPLFSERERAALANAFRLARRGFS